LQEIIDSTRRVNLNNESLVLKICYGKTSLLLSGDAEREAEGVMSRQYRSFLKSDVLKVGHHGSKTSSSDIYLHYVQPQFAIISVGEKNKFKHPSPATVERLQNMGASVLRTDRLGAVVMESDGERWSVVDWRK